MEQDGGVEHPHTQARTPIFVIRKSAHVVKARWKGLTVQLWVGDIETATDWYERLLGRPPDFVPRPDLKEWELVPDTWLQISTSKNPGQMSRLRLGVEDLEGERGRLIHDLGIDATEIERIGGAAAWCNFQDPWGNRIGLFQDLAKFP